MMHFDIPDPIIDSTRQMFKELENDLRPSKIDLGIGIYRDEKGEAPVFKAVKKAEEILLKKKQKNFHPIILRPSTVNGFSPRLRLDVVVNIMTNLAYHNNKITVFGGDQLRPNIYIEDMIRAYLCVLEAPLHLVSGEIFNVGDENLTVNEIALSVKKIFKESRR